jgi:exosortase K
MKSTFTIKTYMQLTAVLLCALAIKFFYSTASPDELRWILAPTTFLVELVSGIPFEFESYAGYTTADRSFVIAASCAGVNFLITSFLMLSLTKLWRGRSQNPSPGPGWKFIPVAAVFAYLATLVANTVRISTALRLHRMPLGISWLGAGQLHRLEGIFTYFGFLLLMFMISERMNDGIDGGRSLNGESPSRAPRRYAQLRRAFFPLAIYYATTLGLPLANGAYRQGADFWEHALFVLLTPLLLILPLATFCFYRNRRLRLILLRQAGSLRASQSCVASTQDFKLEYNQGPR